MPRVRFDKAHRIGGTQADRIPVPGEAARKKADQEARAEQKERAALNRERSAAIRAGTRLLIDIRRSGKFSTHEECMNRMKYMNKKVWRAYVKANKPIEEA